MRPIKKIASLLALFSITSLYGQDNSKASVLVCYGDINPDKVQGYKYVILESEHFNPFDIKLIQENNELILGYISLGEVSPSRFYFNKIREKTLGKNPIWDSYYLDLEDETTQIVIFELIDKIVKKGFNGLFLDTVDTYGPWGPHKEKAGAYIRFISKVKDKYPSLHIMQNAGLALVPRAKAYINSVAIESIVTDYSFEKEEYRMRKTSDFLLKAEELKSININHGLPVVLIEYADSKGMFNRVKHHLTNLKWDYFIGNIGLETLPKFK